jgi:WD40 repeat protein
LIDFHKGDITGVDTFPFQHYAITSGSDGTVRIWDYSKSTKTSFVVSKVQFDGPLTCITTNRKNHLVGVGSENGVVRLLEAHNVRRPLLLHKMKIHSDKVTAIKFDTKGKLLATGSLDCKVCLIDISTTEFIVLGYVSFPGPIQSLAWNMTETFQHLFISVDHDHGDVFRIVPPEKPAESLQLKNRDVQKSLLKLNWTPLGLCMDPRSSSSKKQHFFCLTSDKKLKRYSMPERTGDPDLMDDSDIAPPKEEFIGHQKVGSAIQVSFDGKWIATGAKDGVIILRPVTNPTESKILKGHHPRVAGVTELAFSFDSQYPLYIILVGITVSQICNIMWREYTIQ